MKAYLKTHRFFFVGAGVIVAALVLFKALGWHLCAVQSGSMEPAIPTYSICLVNTHVSYDSLKIGDIIVYERESDNARIIHRVTEITADGIVTKGDANQFDDGVSVTAGNLFARYVGHVPNLARLYNFLFTPYGICIAVGLGVYLFVSDIVDSRRHKS